MCRDLVICLNNEITKVQRTEHWQGSHIKSGRLNLKFVCSQSRTIWALKTFSK
ncbi:hypothetical protein VCR9J2_1350027 [Vibrio crassostreae]|nr:hypothetical protein VCR9J2_1350027 [Vibrio crassostreae]